MRNRFVAGNWKMNLSDSESKSLAEKIAGHSYAENTQVVLCTPFLYLKDVLEATSGNAKVAVGAQNCHEKDAGAYTGEISAAQLASAGIPYVILGHSERRTYYKEDNALLKSKTDAALAQGLQVIFCCGEVLEEREANKQAQVVETQLQEALGHLSTEQMSKVVIAYEPVWAIGTGKTASAAQAQDMHEMIRNWVANQFGAAHAEQQIILYGGSCKPGNAAELFAQKDVDGGLIGGASLKAEDFIQIIEA